MAVVITDKTDNEYKGYTNIRTAEVKGFGVKTEDNYYGD